MFTEIAKDLGTIKVGKKVEVLFPYAKKSVITKMISPCDCSNIVDMSQESMVKITYIPKPIPAHLKQEGKSSYKTDKVFDIYALVNGENIHQKISFTAIIVE